MQIIKWSDGGFGMAAHNYDGDMLTDEVAQVHRSPGFITSNLIGQSADGSLIKEFEASHGTVADLWHMHLAGKETSLNPLGLAEALIGAVQHSCKLEQAKQMMGSRSRPSSSSLRTICGEEDCKRLLEFCTKLRSTIHACMASGCGTRDLCGPKGLTTEKFIACVAQHLRDGTSPSTSDGQLVNNNGGNLSGSESEVPPGGSGSGSAEASAKVGVSMGLRSQATGNGGLMVSRPVQSVVERDGLVDEDKLAAMFKEFDLDGDGKLNMAEFSAMMNKLNIAPLKPERLSQPRMSLRKV